MCSPGACARRVDIYFPGRSIRLGQAFTFRVGICSYFHDKKKIPGPSMCSPGACARRVGIYFPGMLLLFGYAFTFRVGVYSSGRHLLSG